MFLAILVLAGHVARASEVRPQAAARYANSRLLNVRFTTSDQGGRDSHVDLWYTTDRAATWRRWTSTRTVSTLEGIRSESSDRSERSTRSIRFLAESEGLYGFFIVLHNAAGASSDAPIPGAGPQQWIWVDETPPRVLAFVVGPQVVDVRALPDEGTAEILRIDWRVADDHHPDRPVSLHYRSAGDDAFKLVAESLPAKGSFDWSPPKDARGLVEIKLASRDQAGNRAIRILQGAIGSDEQAAGRMTGSTVQAADGRFMSVDDENFFVASSATSSPVEPAAMKSSSAVSAAIGSAGPHGEPDAGPAASDPAGRSESRRKYDQGTWHRLRGETDLAIARYREAIELDPNSQEARHDLAAVLLLLGREQDALTELHTLLEQNPNHRAGLKTLALAAARLKNYRTASESLQKLLLLDPEDGEGWLYYGDVVLFSGDRGGARAAWGRIEALSTATPEMKDRARRRLELYPETAVRK